MREATSETVDFPASSSRDVLTELLRQGAQEMPATAIEAEVAEWIARHEPVTEEGHRLMVRSGYLPKWKITTGVGPIDVKRTTLLVS